MTSGDINCGGIGDCRPIALRSERQRLLRDIASASVFSIPGIWTAHMP